MVWVGLPVALGWALWRVRRDASARRPMLCGFVAGVALWGAAQVGLGALQRTAPPLPPLTLATIDGRPVALDAYRGRPVVINLWASWCPPCRREMPVLEKAQADHPDVTFLMINQGEAAHTVEAFVQSQGLQFNHLLLDPASQAMQAASARALPTTLFYDTQGRLVEAHLGELTAARLRDTLQRRLHRAPVPPPPRRTSPARASQNRRTTAAAARTFLRKMARSREKPVDRLLFMTPRPRHPADTATILVTMMSYQSSPLLWSPLTAALRWWR